MNKLIQLIISVTLLISQNIVEACTASKIIAKDGSVIYGRTLEFSHDIHSNILVIPRNYKLIGTAEDGGPGLAWHSKYAVVGANFEGQKAFVDGVNESGLAVGSFYFPGYAEYQHLNPKDINNSISSIDVGVWLLTNFATIDDVKRGLANIKVSNAKFKSWGFTVPLHYIVTEKSGKSLVIEYIKGKLHLYDNPLGAFTNSPDFKWMQTNLRNYVNISPLNVSEVKVNQTTVQSFGQGVGMHGLPGDFTPPSRFVRSAVFTASAEPVDNAKEAIFQIFHLLNNFDLPKGAIREIFKGEQLVESTLWTSAIDLKNARYYFHTYENRDIKLVDLNKFDLNAKDIQLISMSGNTKINDVSKTAKSM